MEAEKPKLIGRWALKIDGYEPPKSLRYYRALTGISLNQRRNQTRSLRFQIPQITFDLRTSAVPWAARVLCRPTFVLNRSIPQNAAAGRWAILR